MPRVRELRVTYSPHPSGAEIDGRSAANPRTAAAILTSMIGDQAVEVFTILLLNARNRLLAVHDVSRGNVNHTAIEPATIFRAALLANAAGIILAHNHPSGDSTPSEEDITLTNRIRAAGDLLGITVIDHIVIGDGNYCSFKETGRI